MYYSEIGKIIEAGLERDKDKVASFAQLLAKKMAADGEERGSKRIGDILERKNRSKAVTDSLIAPPPVDQESRMNIVEIDYQPVVNDLILSKAVELKLMDFMETINNKEKMDQIGLELNMSLLLYGHPGCGKTSAAKYIASQLGLPLVVARLDTLILTLLRLWPVGRASCGCISTLRRTGRFRERRGLCPETLLRSRRNDIRIRRRRPCRFSARAFAAGTIPTTSDWTTARGRRSGARGDSGR